MVKKIENLPNAEAKRIEKLEKLIEALLERSSLDYGWHENPNNHTLKVHLYFGSRDPQHLVQMNKYSHAKLTMEVLEFLAEAKETEGAKS
jgi:hypothetical protein